MKNILNVVLISVLVLASALVMGQTIKPLKIGDKVPDIYFAKMLNHNTENGRLSDFAGKAIVIDLWFRECLPCIRSMPHLDSLQREFKNDLQVLPITWQSKAKIEEFWQNDLGAKNIKLTQVVEDTLIRKLFPAVTFPHQIWIDKNGIVVAITNGENASQENIRKLVGNLNLKITEKKDELNAEIRWGRQPLIVTRFEENKQNLLHYSYFSRYRKEFNASVSPEIDTINRLVRWKFTNLNFIKLYHYAYANTTAATFYRGKRVLRKDHNPMKSESKSIDLSNKFCYDIIYSDTSLATFGKFMIPDLDRFLGFKSYEEVQKVSCLIIRPNGNGNRYYTSLTVNKQSRLYNRVLEVNKIFSSANQSPWSLERTVNQFIDQPLLFEFKDQKPINFAVTWDVANLKKMNLELANYDLKVEQAIRKIKIVVLEDAKLK